MLTKAALLAYERLHVAKSIMEKDWNSKGNPECESELLIAWCFDVINSGEPSSSQCSPHIKLIHRVESQHPEETPPVQPQHAACT